MTDRQWTSGERLVERDDGPVGRKRPKPRSRCGHLHKAMRGERASSECVEPVVEVADDQSRQVSRLVKEGVLEQVLYLPVPLALGEAQVPVHQMERPLGRLDHGELRPRGFRRLRRSEIW